jgi:hypothetical protein
MPSLHPSARIYNKELLSVSCLKKDVIHPRAESLTGTRFSVIVSVHIWLSTETLHVFEILE